MSEKFKVGDKVMPISIPPISIGTVVQLEDGEHGGIWNDWGPKDSQKHVWCPTYLVQHAKPLTDLWEDEKTCREIAELMIEQDDKPVEFYEFREGTHIQKAGRWIGIHRSGKLSMGIMTEIDLFKLTQLLAERGYYPVEE